MASWCPNCGRQTNEGEKFCRKCGMPQHLRGEEASEWILSAQKSTSSQPEAPRTRPVNQSPTNPNSQTGPAYLPPQESGTSPQIYLWPAMTPGPQGPHQPPAQTGHTNIRLG